MAATRRGGGASGWLILIVVVALLAVAAWWWHQHQADQTATAPPDVSQQAPPPLQEAPVVPPSAPAPPVVHPVFDPVKAAADQLGPRPFITPASETPADPTALNPNRIKYYDLPVKRAIDSPFYDQPYVVNVPFNVPFQADVFRVYYHVSLHWEDPADGKIRDIDSNHDLNYQIVNSVGIYRWTGRALPADAVRFDSSGVSADHADWKALAAVETEAGQIYRAKDAIAFVEPQPHVGFTTFHDGPRRGEQSNPSFVLSSCPSGSYVLALGLDPAQWPVFEPRRESAKLHYHVDLAICRGEKGLDQSDLAYIFAKGPWPDSMPDADSIHALSFDIPVTLQRDAWVFAHSVIVPTDPKLEQKQIPFGGGVTKIEYSAVPGAAEVNLSLTSTLISDPEPKGYHERTSATPAAELAKDENTWLIHLPATVPDFSFTTLPVDQVATLTIDKYNLYLENEKNPEKLIKQLRPFDVHAPNWEPYNSIAQGMPSWTVYAVLIADSAKVCPDAMNPPLLQPNSDRYGPQLKDWWITESRSLKDLNDPQAGSPPFKFLFFGKPPTNVRQMIAGDAGIYPLISLHAGAWNVIGYYKRQKDVEGN